MMRVATKAGAWQLACPDSCVRDLVTCSTCAPAGHHLLVTLCSGAAGAGAAL